ncbi:MAG: hypothetical protein ACRYFX_25125 [Janthinobacterium lividum]
MKNQGKGLSSQRRNGRVLLVLAGCLALGACSGAHEPVHASAAAHGVIAPTTNVPALLGASIDRLQQRLGAPLPLPPAVRRVFEQNKNLASNDSMATFRTGGITLIANYDISTRQVHDLLLLGHHEDSLMGRASLRANADSYILLPVFRDNQSSQFMGLRVVAVQ